MVYFGVLISETPCKSLQNFVSFVRFLPTFAAFWLQVCNKYSIFLMTPRHEFFPPTPRKHAYCFKFLAVMRRGWTFVCKSTNFIWISNVERKWEREQLICVLWLWLGFLSLIFFFVDSDLLANFLFYIFLSEEIRKTAFFIFVIRLHNMAKE